MEESHGHWGCRKSEEKTAYFGVLQIKGELKRLSIPGSCQGAAVGTGGRERREGASNSGLECPRAPDWVSGGALGIPTPPHHHIQPESPLHEGYSLTPSVSIRLLPGLGDDMVSPLPPRRLRRRRSPFLGPSVTGPGPRL